MTSHTRAAPSAELRTPPELESRPRTPFEEAVMRDLACTCGTCELEPIVSCRCDYAAKLRAEVLAELDTLALSTEDQRRSAVESVRKALIARHGPKIVRRGVDADGHFAEVAVGSMVMLGLLVVVLFRRLRRLDDDISA